ncbi:unnamed protein product [Nesidiocoris tenuis]|uniref:Uncharacterized protein n=1 Tax=Nesidiocoris tenuis TaxID=355587 RepID=A0A6H5GDW0_9HEMI|nr:unnamed protein product [Nesidiocoris tenuis]
MILNQNYNFFFSLNDFTQYDYKRHHCSGTTYVMSSLAFLHILQPLRSPDLIFLHFHVRKNFCAARQEAPRANLPTTAAPPESPPVERNIGEKKTAIRRAETSLKHIRKGMARRDTYRKLSRSLKRSSGLLCGSSESLLEKGSLRGIPKGEGTFAGLARNRGKGAIKRGIRHGSPFREVKSSLSTWFTLSQRDTKFRPEENPWERI